MGQWIYVEEHHRSESSAPVRNGQIAEAIRLLRFLIIIITILAAITGMLLRDRFTDKLVKPANDEGNRKENIQRPFHTGPL